MEVKLNCFSLLSLRDLALGRIAVVLANKPAFLATMKPFSVPAFFSTQWMEPLWREVERTISELSLPASMKKEMVPILKTVGSEILKWKFIHRDHLKEIDGHVVEKLCWTTAGAIDYEKTAETLVGSDVLDILERFELACLYCMGDFVPALWNELPEREKKKVCKRTDPSQVDPSNMQLFFPYIFEKNDRCNWYISAYRRCNFSKYPRILGNKAVSKYCLNELVEEERKAVLLETALGVINFTFSDSKSLQRPDVLCYLLSLMTSEEQLRILKVRPCKVLTCFLHWPWQNLFLDIADIVWKFLDQSKYEDLLLEIKAYIHCVDYYLPNFIQEFFLRSPMEFKKQLIDEECRDIFFFRKFFIQEDFKSIQVFFKNMDTVGKERLLISRDFLNLIDNFLLNDQWQIVEECIQQAELSKEYGKRLKDAFAEFVKNKDSRIETDWRKNKRKIFFDLLGERNTTTIQKRKNEGETLVPIKKLCTEE